MKVNCKVNGNVVSGSKVPTAVVKPQPQPRPVPVPPSASDSGSDSTEGSRSCVLAILKKFQTSSEDKGGVGTRLYRFFLAILKKFPTSSRDKDGPKVDAQQVQEADTSALPPSVAHSDWGSKVCEEAGVTARPPGVAPSDSGDVVDEGNYARLDEVTGLDKVSGGAQQVRAAGTSAFLPSGAPSDSDSDDWANDTITTAFKETGTEELYARPGPRTPRTLPPRNYRQEEWFKKEQTALPEGSKKVVKSN